MPYHSNEPSCVWRRYYMFLRYSDEFTRYRCCNVFWIIDVWQRYTSFNLKIRRLFFMWFLPTKSTDDWISHRTSLGGSSPMISRTLRYCSVRIQSSSEPRWWGFNILAPHSCSWKLGCMLCNWVLDFTGTEITTDRMTLVGYNRDPSDNAYFLWLEPAEYYCILQ